jgi:hypothetical protein
MAMDNSMPKAKGMPTVPISPAGTLKQGYRAEQIEAELSARTVETKATGK